MNVTRDGGEHARPLREDRHSHAADPDADPATDREVPGSCAPSDGAGGLCPRRIEPIVYEDLEEETLQVDAELVEKEMINEAHTLLAL